MINLASPECWLILSVILYFIMNGAQVFETAVIVPKWTAAPPESFYLFKGKHGLDFKWFWIIMHSIHEVAFVTAVCLCWGYAEIQYWLLLLLLLHFAVRIWTLAYFAPNIIAFQNLANDNSFEISNMERKVQLWRKLNYLRILLFIGINIALVPICIKLIAIVYS